MASLEQGCQLSPFTAATLGRLVELEKDVVAHQVSLESSSWSNMVSVLFQLCFGRMILSPCSRKHIHVMCGIFAAFTGTRAWIQASALNA